MNIAGKSNVNSGNYYENTYIPSIIKWGKLTLLLGIMLSFAPIVVVSVVFGYMPPISAILTGAASMFTAYGVLYVIEPVSYFPILGIPGTYLSFLAGNISNMRVPCSIVAQEAAGVKQATEEGSIIATIGIAISVIVNVIILSVGVIAGSSIIASLPPSVIDAFNLILPALMGAIFIQFAVRDPKIGLIALLIASVLTFMAKKGYLSFLPINPSFLIIVVSIFGTVLIGRKLSKVN